MINLYNMLGKLLKTEDVVFVSIVDRTGSAPAGTGAKMLVTHQGRVAGTVGGGAVEYTCEQTAADVLKQKESCIKEFVLRENEVQDLGMICGGNVTVYFQYMAAGDEDMIKRIDTIREMWRLGKECWLIYHIREGQIQVSDKPLQEMPKETCYQEQIIRPGRVYIFGGGHVAQALVPVLSLVAFRCVILEDREAFCRKELFPEAEEVRLIDNADIFQYVTIEKDDYVCIMTRGHKDDLMIQEQVLKTPASYIGVIGSRKKMAMCFEKLRGKGYTQEDLERISTPIGLDIKAETVQEIGISIAAELIKHRAERER